MKIGVSSIYVKKNAFDPDATYIKKWVPELRT